jgi:zinc D-Ala-D-Ala carboxypeptidase
MATRSAEVLETMVEVLPISGEFEVEPMLSRYFSLEQLTFSELGRKKSINNMPSDKQIENLKYLCTMVLDPLKEKLGKNITVVSGFRSRELNAAMFGSPESWHMAEDDKAAVDIICKGASLKRIAETLDELQMPFDKVIISYDRAIVHIQARRPKRENIARKIVGGVVRYQAIKG